MMLVTTFNILLMILGFTALIFVHELGHFLAARWAGIRTEAFAIGMGPCVLSFRKGVGFRFGSSERETVGRVERHLRAKHGVAPGESGGAGETGNPGEQAAAQVTQRQVFDAMDELGLGETEYSLRWLPIGGFVKMLGQEDANPNAISDDPRSYQRCAVGKRMIVVSAGVVMNLIFAVLLFVVVFLAGVKFEAPIVGSVDPDGPAGMTLPRDAEALGIQTPGLLPGDRILSVNGEPQPIFNDVAIEIAMSRPGSTIVLEIEREGYDQPILFDLQPENDPRLGFLAIGVGSARSTTLPDRDTRDGDVMRQLERAGLARQGVTLGMTLTEINGTPVSTMQQVDRVVRNSRGEPLTARWSAGDSTVTTTIASEPQFEQLIFWDGAERVATPGLIGLTPLTRVGLVVAGAPADGVLRAGDVIVRIGATHYPVLADVPELIRASAGRALEMVVRREGRFETLRPTVGRDGRLGFFPEPLYDETIIARSVTDYALQRVNPNDPPRSRPTPIAGANPMAGARIIAVDGQLVMTWGALREALRAATHEAFAAGGDVSVELAVELPIEGAPRETMRITLGPEDVKSLHALGWESDLRYLPTDAMYTTLSADGDPLRAAAMGFERTKKFVLHTYLTIDRLFRGSVAVDQLRGPVGIVHLGVQVADRGLLYLLFLLAVISVNLAVINFLPLPIVDGGLFLFLIYERFVGRPPSLAFQNAATIVGLVLIAGIFLLTFYNDLSRLITGS